MDPFELAQDESIGYGKWYVDYMFAFAPAGAYIGQWLQSFREFPPRQKPGSFNVDRVMEAITEDAGFFIRKPDTFYLVAVQISHVVFYNFRPRGNPFERHYR